MEKYYHPLTLFLNIYLCGKIRNKIQSQVIKSQKIKPKTYGIFALCVISILLVNLTIFLFVQKPNLYEQLQIPRSFTLNQVKQHGNEVKLKIMTMDAWPLQLKLNYIKKLENMINVLSHPARRLSYDSFGYSQTQYAWSFKSQQFLLSMIIQSAVFYVICTFMSMINSRKSQVKQTLKTQIFVMILLFLWQIDLIMTTQSKLHLNQTDFLDKIFFAFPIFQRRQVLKSILIPAMNMVDIFVLYFIKNDNYKRIKLFGVNQKLRVITNSVSSTLPEANVDDKQFQQKIVLKIEQATAKDKFKGQVFKLNRDILNRLYVLGLENLLPDPQIRRISAYFKLPFMFKQNK